MLALTSTACTDRSLLTADELKAALGTATPTNDQVTALRGRVEQTIVRACRVPAAGVTPPTLRVEGVTETFRFKSSQHHLQLARKPTVSIVSITENDTVLTVGTDYENEPATGVVRRLASDVETCWPCGKIVVVYTAGWATVPDDLKLAASRLALFLWSEPDDPTLRRESIPGVIEREWWVVPSTGLAIPREVMELLGPFMQLAVG